MAFHHSGCFSVSTSTASSFQGHDVQTPLAHVSRALRTRRLATQLYGQLRRAHGQPVPHRDLPNELVAQRHVDARSRAHDQHVSASQHGRSTSRFAR